MSGMADPLATDGLWNWHIAAYLDGLRVRTAISAVLDRPVVPLGAVPGQDGAVLCDVWHAGGDFPTQVDCYLVPDNVPEPTAASAVAVRLGHDCLLADGTLNPTRYLLAEPDGTLRAVHADEIETDDGTQHCGIRPCTGAEPSCATWPGCERPADPASDPPSDPASNPPTGTAGPESAAA
jgi:hypothetical protein